MTQFAAVGPSNDLAAEAISLWRATQSRAFHGPGCGCCGAQPIVLDPVTLREDIEYALVRRYRAAGRSDLQIVVEQAGASAAGNFTSWLAMVANAGAAGAIVLGDVVATLASMTDARGKSR